jgi:ubiquinone biosynthesis protein
VSLHRLRTITRVLAPLLTAEVAAGLTNHGVPDRTEFPREISPAVRRARVARQALEQLGPFWIKIGQLLSTRPDFVPAAMIEEFRCLHDEVAVAPFSDFAPVLDDELGRGGCKVLREIHTDRPLGSASLAQVYAATLHDGRPAVVKIQRPGVVSVVLQDMKLLRRAARTIGRGAPRFNAVINVDTMLGTVFDAMRAELDFTVEATNMDRARLSVRKFSYLSVPDVVVATPRVLVQSLAPGVSIRDVDCATIPTSHRLAVGRDLLGLMLHDYFVTRVFHADPHPGNLFVAPDAPASLIDWGMVGRVDRHISNGMLMVLLNLARNDAAATARSWIAVGASTPWADLPGFVSDMTTLVPRVATASLDELDFGVTLGALLAYSTRRGIHTPPMIALLAKSFSNVEGSVRYIAPELMITQVFRDELQSIAFELARELSSDEDVARLALELIFAANDLPSQFRSVVRDLADREFTMQLSTLQGNRAGTGTPDNGVRTLARVLFVLGAIKLWIDRRR